MKRLSTNDIERFRASIISCSDCEKCPKAVEICEALYDAYKREDRIRKACEKDRSFLGKHSAISYNDLQREITQILDEGKP